MDVIAVDTLSLAPLLMMYDPFDRYLMVDGRDTSISFHVLYGYTSGDCSRTHDFGVG